MSTVPEDLRYTENHEWIRVEGDEVLIGITDHAQSQMGDIVYVELPEPPVDVKKGDEIAVLESVKASEPVYAPLSGRIVAINEELPDNAAWVNDEPYGRGWMVRIRISDPSEVEELLDPPTYKSLIGE